jgi:hypothetical protein
MSCILIILIIFLWNLGFTKLWLWCAESLTDWQCPNFWAAYFGGWLVGMLLCALFRQARPSE